MSEQIQITMPTCGKIVHYFPLAAGKDNAGNVKCPAVVLNDSMTPDVSVLLRNHLSPVMYAPEVPHKSAYSEGGSGYWDWPEIKR